VFRDDGSGVNEVSVVEMMIIVPDTRNLANLVCMVDKEFLSDDDCIGI